MKIITNTMANESRLFENKFPLQKNSKLVVENNFILEKLMYPK